MMFVNLVRRSVGVTGYFGNAFSTNGLGFSCYCLDSNVNVNFDNTFLTWKAMEITSNGHIPITARNHTFNKGLETGP